MSAEFLILDNEKAAKLFSQSGYDAVPEEVFPESRQMRLRASAV